MKTLDILFGIYIGIQVFSVIWMIYQDFYFVMHQQSLKSLAYDANMTVLKNNFRDALTERDEWRLKYNSILAEHRGTDDLPTAADSSS